MSEYERNHLSGADLLLTHNVTPVLPGRRENLLGDPVLEVVGDGFVRAHDDLVEAALGDDGSSTGRAQGGTPRQDG